MGSNKRNGFFKERVRRFNIRYSFIQKKAKTFTIPGFRDVPLYYVIKFFFKGIVNGAITTRASAVAFSFLFSNCTNTNLPVHAYSLYPRTRFSVSAPFPDKGDNA